MLLCGKEPMRLKSGSSFSALESERYYHVSSRRQFFLVEKMISSASELELVALISSQVLTVALVLPMILLGSSRISLKRF